VVQPGWESGVYRHAVLERSKADTTPVTICLAIEMEDPLHIGQSGVW
jgi:hypothetical protein